MRMKLYTLLCISFFLLFTACNQDDDPVPPEVGSRTVLVYIVADNNLSSFAKEDVEEMIAGMESVDLSSSNLLVYQDDRVAPVLFRISRNKKGRLEKEIIKEYAEQVSTPHPPQNKSPLHDVASENGDPFIFIKVVT